MDFLAERAAARAEGRLTDQGLDLSNASFTKTVAEAEAEAEAAKAAAAAAAAEGAHRLVSSCAAARAGVVRVD